MIQKIANWKIIGALGVSLLIFIVYLFPKYHDQMGAYAGYDILALDERFFYNQDLVNKSFSDLGEEGRNVNLFLLKSVDMIFPLNYGVFLFFVIVWLSGSIPNRFIKFSGMASLIAAFLDYFENFGLIKLLNDFPEITAEQVNRVSTLTSMKWFFILVSIFTISFLVIRNIWLWYSARK